MKDVITRISIELKNIGCIKPIGPLLSLADTNKSCVDDETITIFMTDFYSLRAMLKEIQCPLIRALLISRFANHLKLKICRIRVVLNHKQNNKLPAGMKLRVPMKENLNQMEILRSINFTNE